MREVKCRRCKSLFDPGKNIGGLCKNCQAQDEELYLKVRAYVKDHPGISVAEVAEVLKIPHTTIMSYLKDERLEITAGSKSFLSCSVCGKKISTGQFCEECKRTHGDNKPVITAAPKKEGKTTSKMFTAGGK